jgi:hypothetical protein
MKTRALKILIILILVLESSAAMGMELGDLPALVKKIPPRVYSAMSGSEFAKYVSARDGSWREDAILAQLIEGNLPNFLRKLQPVHLTQRLEDGKTALATIFVMPDYLAIGSDRDFLLIPMGLYTATEIAVRYGFILPTKKMVDAIFDHSAFRFPPEPLPPGPQMRSTAYYWKHNQKVKKQRAVLGFPAEALVSGHKKDVVLTNRLAHRDGRVAIYGWHRDSGEPIQALSTIHGAEYADYSHGVRLVSEGALLNGEPCSVYKVLEDERLAGILSDEGVIQEAKQIMTLHRRPPPVHPVWQSSSFFKKSGM